MNARWVTFGSVNAVAYVGKMKLTVGLLDQGSLGIVNHILSSPSVCPIPGCSIRSVQLLVLATRYPALMPWSGVHRVAQPSRP